MANRLDSGIVHGDILVNGQTPSSSRNLSATVYQQDLQFSTATVKDALIFSALLRQPKTTPVVEKIAYAEEVLNLIGMEALADEVIGASGEGESSHLKKLSNTYNSTALNSEQRKRLSIGIELAAKPTNLLLLDQPLAGLDSQAALSICQLLRQIAQKGLAILCVVNQPSSRLLQAFDRLLLLGEGGKQLYFGKIGLSCKTMIGYFEKNGARPCRADENPAEWTLDVTSSKETRDWSEIWNKSPESKATKSKLSQLRKKFSATADLADGLDSSNAVRQSAPGFDAMALQRKFILATRFGPLTHSIIGAFYKYLHLEKMQLPAAYPTDVSASWLTNGAAVLPPAYLS